MFGYLSFNFEKGVDRVWHSGQSGAINITRVYLCLDNNFLKLEVIVLS
jgi:hypothetical protein